MAIEALQKIKKQETSAREKLLQAQDEARKIIFAATLKAEALSEDIKKKAKQRSREMLKEKNLSAAGEAEKIIEEARREAGNLRKHASEKINQAAESLANTIKNRWQ
ncbi:MAG: hypothetical protein ABIH01_00780 [Candidatus Omnitrophota bacterium]